MINKSVPYTIRLPAKLYKELKNRYAETYPKHRLSFNSWLVDVMESSQRK
jgi:hypothetical protein